MMPDLYCIDKEYTEATKVLKEMAFEIADEMIS